MLAPRRRRPQRGPQGHLLETQPSDCPIDTVVVLMMENRSFDHYLGWLGSDEKYLEAGRSRWGKKFEVDGKIDQTYVDGDGKRHRDAPPHARRRRTASVPWLRAPDPGARLVRGARRAGRRVPRRGYRQRPVRDRLLPGRGPAHLRAPRATVHRPTTARSRRCSPAPSRTGSTRSPRSRAAIGKTRYRSSRACTRPRRSSGSCSNGRCRSRPTTPTSRSSRSGVDAVRPVDPSDGRLLRGVLVGHARQRRRHLARPSRGDLRTDDHPQGDVRLGQRFIREVFDAFARSDAVGARVVRPHLRRVGWLLRSRETADAGRRARQRRHRERLRPRRASGSRTIMASPYARQNYVDHRVYDHTSILRFLEWRFLGAPPEGPGGDPHVEPHAARSQRQQRRRGARGHPPRPRAGVRPRPRRDRGPTASRAPRTR